MTWFADGSISISGQMLKQSPIQHTGLSDGLRDFLPDWCKCQACACTACQLGIIFALTACKKCKCKQIQYKHEPFSFQWNDGFQSNVTPSPWVSALVTHIHHFIFISSLFRSYLIVLTLIISSHALNTTILKWISIPPLLPLPPPPLLGNLPQVTLYTENQQQLQTPEQENKKAAPTSSQIPAPQAPSTSQHRTRAKGQII